MALGKRNSGLTPIAIEFGVGSLKVLQLEQGEPPALVAAACLDTPEHLHGDHEGRLGHQCQAVGELLTGAGFRGKRAICSIPAPLTFVQHIQVQKSEGISLSDQVTGRLQTQLQCDLRRVIVRQFEVGDLHGPGGTRTEILCIAVARDVVMRIMKTLRTHKLEVVGAHCEHVALARVFDRVTRRQSDRELTSMYLDLGVGATKIVLTHGRDIVFAKTIRVAGMDLDAAISRALGCELNEARARRLAMGRSVPEPVKSAAKSDVERSGAGATSDLLTREAAAAESANANASAVIEQDRRTGAPAPGLTPPVDGMSDCDIEEPLEAPIQSLTSEIGMCMRHHDRLFPDRPVGRAVFVGGESRDLALCQRIARSLHLPAQIADPLTCVRKPADAPSKNIDLNAPQPGWATAFGLCFAPRNL